MKQKKQIFLLTISILFLACSAGFINIKTNYFDLPDDKTETFNSLLKIKNEQLTEESLEKMQNYIEKNVLADINPTGNGGVESNYFWYIYNALPDFVDEKERHQGYYAGQNEQSFEEKLIAYSIYRIDRSPENLQKIFELVKPNLKNIITEEKYQELELNYKINRVITSYNLIIEIEDYKNKLQEAYNHADTATGIFNNYGSGDVFEKFRGAYGFTAWNLDIMISQHLGVYDRNSGPIFYSSFWMRRNHEGNMEKVYEILNEIQSIYGN
ncbi:MAG: hypothetical protein JXL97_07565 [Bacteroidales bacterium]|nr:hypothetical protein [Bacteroidales bacterium]